MTIKDCSECKNSNRDQHGKCKFYLDCVYNNQRNFAPIIKRIHPNRVLYDLKSIKGYAKCVPKDVSPDEDKGIYFEKLMQFIDSVINKYEDIKK